MHPDAFIPFYGNDYFQAVEGHDELIAIAYLRAIWYYWHQNHCKGLRDDDEFLRRLCRVEKDQWERVRAIIFDNEKFFTQDAEFLWHQKRAEEEWRKSVEKYDAAVNRGKAGAKSRWKN